jgi:CubicO group peptidase (beta-lactamase class C family)
MGEKLMHPLGIAAGAIGYGYQWWVHAGAGLGNFLARGIYGKYIYIYRDAGVVVAVNAADWGFVTPDRMTATSQSIAALLPCTNNPQRGTI